MQDIRKKYLKLCDSSNDSFEWAHFQVEYQMPDQVPYVTILYRQLEKREETFSYQLFLFGNSVNGFLLMKVYKLCYKRKENICISSAYFYVPPGTNSC